MIWSICSTCLVPRRLLHFQIKRRSVKLIAVYSVQQSLATIVSKPLGRHLHAALEQARHPGLIEKLIGDQHLTKEAFRNTLWCYLKALRDMPREPTILLSLGIAYYARATQRKTADRNMQITQGLAYFMSHLDVMKETGRESMGLYNVARGFHFLGLLQHAAEMYRQILDKVHPQWAETALPAEEEVVDEENVWATMPEETRHSVDCNVTWEAAYNLAHIYQSIGNTLLAQRRSERFALPEYICLFTCTYLALTSRFWKWH